LPAASVKVPIALGDVPIISKYPVLPEVPSPKNKSIYTLPKSVHQAVSIVNSTSPGTLLPGVGMYDMWPEKK
jgi:hypothetical protein